MKQKILPSTWIDMLFTKFHGIYGKEFTSQFSQFDKNGNDVGILNAKKIWAEELGIFHDNPNALKYGLKNLPEKFPNVIRFKEICRNHPKDNFYLIEKSITKEEILKNKQKISELLLNLKK